MGLRLGSRPTSFFIPRHAYAYNRRTFVESLTATRNGSPLFRQRLEYDRSGQITAQQYEHGDGGRLSASGVAYSDADKMLLDAIEDNDITVEEVLYM